MESKTCIFCGGPLAGNKGKEHIFPQWLLDHLGVKDEAVHPTLITYTKEERDGVNVVTGSTIAAKRVQTMNGLVAGNVCRGCNSGWMSELESQAKPLLIPLIDGQRVLTRSPYDWSPDESFLLARWAAKTAYALDRSVPGRSTVPTEHFRLLMSEAASLPLDVRVFAGQQSGKQKIGWHRSPTWNGKRGKLGKPISPAERAEFHDLTLNSYKVGLLAGHLLLLVAFFPHGDWHMVAAEGVHRVLWPWEGPAWELPYEAEAMASLPTLQAFNDSLQIMHFPSLYALHQLGLSRETQRDNED